MLEVESISKAFGDLVAVDDFTFSAQDGEIFGLLGPNGAGKSTTMAIVAGILCPDIGVVSVSGKTDPTIPEVRKDLGIAPQSLAIYGELTAEENLYFIGRVQGIHHHGQLRSAVHKCLEIAELTSRKHDRVNTFSGGMKRRLNLACALIHDPKVILLDEPTAGVDPQSRNHIFSRVKELRNEGKTVIYTTNYIEEVERLCQRVAIVDRGKLLQNDTVENLKKKYGGREYVEAELTETPNGKFDLPGVKCENHIRFETDEPIRDVSALIEKGVDFKRIQIIKPNLETVFLNLTGRKLRQ